MDVYLYKVSNDTGAEYSDLQDIRLHVTGDANGNRSNWLLQFGVLCRQWIEVSGITLKIAFSIIFYAVTSVVASHRTS